MLKFSGNGVGKRVLSAFLCAVLSFSNVQIAYAGESTEEISQQRKESNEILHSFRTIFAMNEILHALSTILVKNKKGAVKNQNNKQIFGNIGLNEGQSEPVGTCEKQENRSFSLSIRYVRTNFSSEKLSCTRPTSEGSCFAKQSEQWLTKPLLSQAKLAKACPTFRPILLRKLF